MDSTSIWKRSLMGSAIILPSKLLLYVLYVIICECTLKYYFQQLFYFTSIKSMIANNVAPIPGSSPMLRAIQPRRGLDTAFEKVVRPQRASARGLTPR